MHHNMCVLISPSSPFFLPCPQQGCSHSFLLNHTLSQHIYRKHIIVCPQIYDLATPQPLVSSSCVSACADMTPMISPYTHHFLHGDDPGSVGCVSPLSPNSPLPSVPSNASNDDHGFGFHHTPIPPNFWHDVFSDSHQPQSYEHDSPQPWISEPDSPQHCLQESTAHSHVKLMHLEWTYHLVLNSILTLT